MFPLLLQLLAPYRRRVILALVALVVVLLVENNLAQAFAASKRPAGQ